MHKFEPITKNNAPSVYPNPHKAFRIVHWFIYWPWRFSCLLVSNSKYLCLFFLILASIGKLQLTDVCLNPQSELPGWTPATPKTHSTKNRNYPPICYPEFVTSFAATVNLAYNAHLIHFLVSKFPHYTPNTRYHTIHFVHSLNARTSNMVSRVDISIWKVILWNKILFRF